MSTTAPPSLLALPPGGRREQWRPADRPGYVLLHVAGTRLVVDGDTVLSTPDQLSGASVSAKVLGESRGRKITGFTYKNKTNNRRRWGHRQTYATIEITSIQKG